MVYSHALARSRDAPRASIHLHAGRITYTVGAKGPALSHARSGFVKNGARFLLARRPFRDRSSIVKIHRGDEHPLRVTRRMAAPTRVPLSGSFVMTTFAVRLRNRVSVSLHAWEDCFQAALPASVRRRRDQSRTVPTLSFRFTHTHLLVFSSLRTTLSLSSFLSLSLSPMTFLRRSVERCPVSAITWKHIHLGPACLSCGFCPGRS